MKLHMNKKVITIFYHRIIIICDTETNNTMRGKRYGKYYIPGSDVKQNVGPVFGRLFEEAHLATHGSAI
jgi:hypothetical protein